MKPQTVKTNRFRAIKRLTMLITFFFILLAAVVAVSQWQAHTPPILGNDGKPLPGSIASLESITLNGVKQWLIIRGQDIENQSCYFSPEDRAAAKRHVSCASTRRWRRNLSLLSGNSAVAESHIHRFIPNLT